VNLHAVRAIYTFELGRSLRTLLHRLDTASVEVEELSVHTPDLDDVFLTLTGTTEEGALR